MTGTVGIKADFLTSKHKRDIERIALSNNLKLHYFTDGRHGRRDRPV